MNSRTGTTPASMAMNRSASGWLWASASNRAISPGVGGLSVAREIRGAGEVLGESQSGEMQEVGFNLYCSMLDAAVKSLKLGKEPDLNAPLGVTTEINLHVPALLPENYVSDVHERLVLYKRFANCENEDVLDLLREELVDRFGPLPDPAPAAP